VARAPRGSSCSDAQRDEGSARVLHARRAHREALLAPKTSKRSFSERVQRGPTVEAAAAILETLLAEQDRLRGARRDAASRPRRSVRGATARRRRLQVRRALGDAPPEHRARRAFSQEAASTIRRSKARSTSSVTCWGTKENDWDKVAKLAEKMATSVDADRALRARAGGSIAWRILGNLIRARQWFERLASLDRADHPSVCSRSRRRSARLGGASSVPPPHAVEPVAVVAPSVEVPSAAKPRRLSGAAGTADGCRPSPSLPREVPPWWRPRPWSRPPAVSRAPWSRPSRWWPPVVEARLSGGRAALRSLPAAPVAPAEPRAGPGLPRREDRRAARRPRSRSRPSATTSTSRRSSSSPRPCPTRRREGRLYMEAADLYTTKFAERGRGGEVLRGRARARREPERRSSFLKRRATRSAVTGRSSSAS
jgi:hypothetical protein